MVSVPAPEPGLVISYGYLWHSENERGREEGLKDRPCAIILSTTNENDDVVVAVLPITHTRPHDLDEAVEIPLPVKRRLGLDDAPSWVVVNEMNRFLWPGPDLRLANRGRSDYGLLPPGLYRTIRERFLACARVQRLQVVPRTE